MPYVGARVGAVLQAGGAQQGFPPQYQNANGDVVPQRLRAPSPSSNPGGQDAAAPADVGVVAVATPTPTVNVNVPAGVGPVNVAAYPCPIVYVTAGLGAVVADASENLGLTANEVIAAPTANVVAAGSWPCRHLNDPLPSSNVVVTVAQDTVAVNDNPPNANVIIASAVDTITINDNPPPSNVSVVTGIDTATIHDTPSGASVTVAAGYDVGIILPVLPVAGVDVAALGADQPASVNVTSVNGGDTFVPTESGLLVRAGSPIVTPFTVPTFVQGNAYHSSASVTSPSLAFTSNVTKGNLIIACGGSAQIGGEGLTCTDSQGNPYTQSGYVGGLFGTNSAMTFNYAVASATGACTVTLNLNQSEPYVRLLIAEYSGASIIDLATYISTSYTGGSPSGTITTARANELIIAWIVDSNSFTSFNSPLTTNVPGATGDATAALGSSGGTALSAGSQTVGANVGTGGGWQAYAFSPPTAGQFVQGNTYASGATSVTSPSLAFTSNVTLGNLLIVAFGAGSSTETYTVTDSQGNSWTTLTQGAFSGGGYQFNVAYCIAGSTGPDTVTVHSAAAENYFRILLHEYSGYKAFDGSSTITHSGSVSTAYITTTADNDLLFAWCVDNNGINSFAPPLTLRQIVAVEATGDNAGQWNNGGTQTITANTAGGGGGMVAAAFKLAGAPFTAVSNNVSGTAYTPGIAIGEPLGAAAVAGYVPGLRFGEQVANVTVVGQSQTPTITGPVNINATPPTANVAVAGVAQTPTIYPPVLPGTNAVTATGYLPSITTTVYGYAAPSTGAVAVTGYALSTTGSIITHAGQANAAGAAYNATVTLTNATQPGHFVQGNSYFSGATAVSSPVNLGFLQNVTAGDLIVVAAATAQYTGEGLSITDSQGNAYSQLNYLSGLLTVNYAMAVSYAIAKTSGPCTVSLSLSAPEPYVRVLIHEYSGYGVFDPGSYITTTYTGSTPTATLTTGTANDLIFAWIVDSSGLVNGFTSPSGMGIRESAGGEPTGDQAGYASTAGPQTLTASTGGGGGGPSGWMAFGFVPAAIAPTVAHPDVGAVSATAQRASTNPTTAHPPTNNVAVVTPPQQPSIVVSQNVTPGVGTVLATAFLPSPPGPGTYVQGLTYFSGSTVVSEVPMTFTQNVVKGDLIVLAAGVQGSFFQISDSQGNVWNGSTQISPPAITNYQLVVYWTVAAQSGPLTVNVNMAGGAAPYVRLMLHEYTGVGPLDVQGAHSYTGGAATMSLTTTVGNDLLFLWCVDSKGTISFTAPLATRLAYQSEATADNAPVTSSPGVQTLTAQTQGGGGGMIALAFEPTGISNAVAYAGQAQVSVVGNLTSTNPLTAHPGLAPVAVTLLQQAGPVPPSTGFYVQGNTFTTTSAPSTSFTISLPSPVTVGDLLVCSAAWTAQGEPTLTDNQGNAWSNYGIGGFSGYAMDVFFATATGTGPYVLTVTFASTATYCRFALHDYTGYLAALDGFGYVNYSGAHGSVTITTTHNSDLLFAWAADGTGRVNSYALPLQVRQVVNGDATGDSTGMSTAGPQTISVTTGGGGGSMYAVSFVPNLSPTNQVFVKSYPPVIYRTQNPTPTSSPVNVTVAVPTPKSVGLTTPVANVGVTGYFTLGQGTRSGSPLTGSTVVSAFAPQMHISAFPVAQAAHANAAGYEPIASLMWLFMNPGTGQVQETAYSPLGAGQVFFYEEATTRLTVEPALY